MKKLWLVISALLAIQSCGSDGDITNIDKLYSEPEEYNTLVFGAKTPVKDLKANQCSANDKEKFIHRTHPTFAEKVRGCGRASLGDKADTAKCLCKEHPELTSDCANCWGDTVACTKEECTWECMFNDRSDDCRRCSKEKCVPALAACTGVPADQLPQDS